MLEIHLSNQGEIEVSGSAAELRAVERALKALIPGSGDRLVFEADASADPDPYDVALKRMVVVKGQGPAKVSVIDAEELRIEGSPESLRAFASYFYFEPDAEPGNHGHFENYEGEDDRWVAAGSLPLVISVR